LDSRFLKLESILNLNKFQKIQDEIAMATDLAVITVDYRGMPVTKHSRCSDLCKIVRAIPRYSKMCEKCDSRGGMEASRMHRPYIYLCHMGIVDFAIPIIVENQYLGALMAGQLLIQEQQENDLLEPIFHHQTAEDLFIKKEFDTYLQKLPLFPMHKVEALSSMLFEINNYIVDEALLKTKLTELIDQVGTTDKRQTAFVDNMMLDKYDTEESILSPAIKYINNNYNKDLDLVCMANLCYISPSYFSKLFRKQLGINFSCYVNKVRIMKSKEMLKSSNASIINIASDAGFKDCGYFIKVFKIYEGVTPNLFRTQYSDRIS
jgi:ligand-binding sensor protein/AraC-like DNA-binding protein